MVHSSPIFTAGFLSVSTLLLVLFFTTKRVLPNPETENSIHKFLENLSLIKESKICCLRLKNIGKFLKLIS